MQAAGAGARRNARDSPYSGSRGTRGASRRYSRGRSRETRDASAVRAERENETYVMGIERGRREGEVALMCAREEREQLARTIDALRTENAQIRRALDEKRDELLAVQIHLKSMQGAYERMERDRVALAIKANMFLRENQELKAQARDA